MSNLLPKTPLITAEDLQAALSGTKPPVLVDCRFRLDDSSAGEAAWRQSRLPGARYAHLERDFSGPVLPGSSGRHPAPEMAAVITSLRHLGVGPEDPVVFYDDAGGPFAARGWWLACHAGHPAAQVLDGGLDAWTAAGGDLETGPAATAWPEAPAWPQRAPLLEAAKVADVLAAIDAGTTLLDARTPERFAGEVEPIDPVAGHIPGASCMPHGGNLTNGGLWRDDQDLALRWEGIDADATICYCGSGVTAAHNVLAAVQAGRGRPRLYVGSWSEWIRDPERPVATGPA
ncbi:MAG: sulfurtransferase [Gammaproteobacteria bacterium]|nr:MAG: sulfurtransferase [Gammaproteobacteria bacterium]